MDSHEVNGALRKCHVPSVQDKVLFFWWESCHFIRFISFPCQRVEILLCVKWYIVFFLACLLNPGQKNKSYGRCQLLPVGLCVEICTTMRASQAFKYDQNSCFDNWEQGRIPGIRCTEAGGKKKEGGGGGGEELLENQKCVKISLMGLLNDICKSFMLLYNLKWSEERDVAVLNYLYCMLPLQNTAKWHAT